MIVLPMSLVHEMGWQSIPLSVAISFVYMVLDKIGDVTENPLKGRSSGTPISSICRTIEIDLLQMLESDFIPEPLPIKQTRHKSSYLD
jgi:putative membrane protein